MKNQNEKKERKEQKRNKKTKKLLMGRAHTGNSLSETVLGITRAIPSRFLWVGLLIRCKENMSGLLIESTVLECVCFRKENLNVNVDQVTLLLNTINISEQAICYQIIGQPKQTWFITLPINAVMRCVITKLRASPHRLPHKKSWKNT